MQGRNPWMEHRGRDERQGKTPGVEELLGRAAIVPGIYQSLGAIDVDRRLGAAAKSRTACRRTV